MKADEVIPWCAVPVAQHDHRAIASALTIEAADDAAE